MYVFVCVYEHVYIAFECVWDRSWVVTVTFGFNRTMFTGLPITAVTVYPVMF